MGIKKGVHGTPFLFLNLKHPKSLPTEAAFNLPLRHFKGDLLAIA